MKTKKEYFTFLKENHLKGDARNYSIPKWLDVIFFSSIILFLFVIPSFLFNKLTLIDNILLIILIEFIILVTLIALIFFIQKKVLWMYRDAFIERELIQQAAHLNLLDIDHKEDPFCKELFEFRKNLKHMTPYDNLELRTT